MLLANRQHNTIKARFPKIQMKVEQFDFNVKKGNDAGTVILQDPCFPT